MNSSLTPSNSVVALFVGGPLNDTREVVSPINGRPPMERRCAEPLPPVDLAVLSANDRVVEPLHEGIYYFKGGTQALDYEGLPNGKRWVEAIYEWQGWR